MDAGSWTALAVFAGLNLLAASSGAVFKPGAWYESLNKPTWTPPNWAFPVVWSILFVLNAAAGWIVWESVSPPAWPALAIYGVSLILNAVWSALFFGARRMRAALIEVVFLWVSLAAVIAAFAPINPAAAWMVAPYLVWVTVAAFLNLRMIQLNPERSGERTA